LHPKVRENAIKKFGLIVGQVALSFVLDYAEHVDYVTSSLKVYATSAHWIFNQTQVHNRLNGKHINEPFERSLWELRSRLFARLLAP